MESIGATNKKTLGRRKIEIKKIEKKTSLQVTFAKRRRGLFRKASELAVLCGAEVAVLVQSPANKIFAFGHPSVGALLDRSPPPSQAAGRCDDGRRKFEEAAMALEMEKRRAAEQEAMIGGGGGGGLWWEGSIEGLEVRELEEYLKALEDLEKNVSERVSEFEKMKISSTSSSSSVHRDFCTSSSVQDFCNVSSSIQDFCTSSSVQDFCNVSSSIQDFCTSSSSIQELGDGDQPYPLMMENGYGLELLDFQDFGEY